MRPQVERANLQPVHYFEEIPLFSCRGQGLLLRIVDGSTRRGHDEGWHKEQMEMMDQVRISQPSATKTSLLL